jgi:hypothetical protein
MTRAEIGDDLGARQLQRAPSLGLVLDCLGGVGLLASP